VNGFLNISWKRQLQARGWTRRAVQILHKPRWRHLHQVAPFSVFLGSFPNVLNIRTYGAPMLGTWRGSAVTPPALPHFDRAVVLNVDWLLGVAGRFAMSSIGIAQIAARSLLSPLANFPLLSPLKPLISRLRGFADGCRPLNEILLALKIGAAPP
jgi:hypothetical protein